MRTSFPPIPAPARRFGARVLAIAFSAALLGCGTAGPGAAPAPGSASSFPLEEVTIRGLQEAMDRGEHTSRSVVELYLRRIEEIDRGGPSLHSMLDLNPDALAIADQMDAERRAGSVRGPLHGIPIVIKDNIDTADGMTTTAGSVLLEGVTATRDAHIVERLRDSGAVLIGKTNLSEWANFRSTNSSSGWSGRGGQARNPYVLDRSPCGSSSGTGVAVAANLAAAGIGTETDGSIVCPSSVSALVGIKPTIGLVSRAGIIPISHSQDTAGPMARTVEDAAILLDAIVGADPRDPATAGATAPPPAGGYAAGLDAGALRGARIGVVREGLTGYSPPADALFEAALRVLAEAGAELIDPADIPHLGSYDAAEWTILLYEFRDGVNRYLAEVADPRAPRTLAEVIRRNEADRGRSMPFFGQEIFELAEATGGLDEAEYRNAVAEARRAGEGLDRVLVELRLDALVAPTGTPAWPIDLINGDHYKGSASSAPAVAGYPHVTVPMGDVNGLPVGLSFIGPAWSEATLIRLAYAYEQRTRHRRPPAFAPTVAY